MDDSFGGGFTQSNIETKQESKAEGILPVFIKMILNQPEDVIHLYNFEYRMITVVGIVRNIEHTSTKITYQLEDISGKMNAHYWVDEDEAPKASNIVLNGYVRVVGGVRTQGDSKAIMIYKIHPISGINELNTHYLEVLNARFQAEEFSKSEGSDLHSVNSGNKMEVDGVGGGGGEAVVNGLEGLTAKERVVFMMIQNALNKQNESGYGREEIIAQFPHFSRDEINRMLQKMAEEGLIYTTIDNDHFQACF